MVTPHVYPTTFHLTQIINSKPGTDGLQKLDEWKGWSTTIVLDHVGQALDHFFWTCVGGHDLFLGILEADTQRKVLGQLGS